MLEGLSSSPCGKDMIGYAMQVGDYIGPEPSLGLSVSPSPQLEAVGLLFAGHRGKPRLRNAIPYHLLIICKTAPQSCARKVANCSTEMGTGAGKEIFT